MGSQESKSVEEFSKHNEESNETEINNTDSAPSTPILTPLDPRSPSTNIARTPLELILGTKTKIDDSTEVKEDDQVITKNVILHVDPRSPSVEFNRTPIIVATTVKEKPLQLTNKNLDNVRKSALETTPVAFTRTSVIKPPKLLGSSPISINPNAHKRRSLVGLLETNIDFTETDLDKAHNMQESVIIEKEEDTSDVTTLSKNELESQMDSLQIESQEAPVIESPIKNVEIGNESEKVEEEKPEDVESKLTVCLDEADNILEEKTINITAHVKDFDKKLTNLIYEDESEDEDNKLGLRLTKIKENNRTPLGVRNSNEEPRKPTSRLRVSDKPRKIEISKIPVFKEAHSKKIGVQCENTPPKKVDEKKIRGKISRWDADKTLII